MPFEIGNRFGMNNVGGARPGAGRKPDAVKRLATTALSDPEKAAVYLASIEELAGNAENEKVRLTALIYLVDRILGKTAPHARQPTPVEITINGSPIFGLGHFSKADRP